MEFSSPDSSCRIREIIIKGKFNIDSDKTIVVEHESELDILVQFHSESIYSFLKTSKFCYRELPNFEWSENTIFVELREVECFEEPYLEEEEDFIYFLNNSPCFTENNYLKFSIKTSFEEDQVYDKHFRIEFRFIVQVAGKFTTNSFFLIFNPRKKLRNPKSREVKISLNKNFKYVCEIDNKRIKFNKDYHCHFNISSKKFDLVNLPSYTLSKILNIPLSTFKETFNSIVSRKFNQKTKSVIIFIIGNGIDEKQLPKRRITILKNSKSTNNLQRFNNFQQTHLVNIVLECIPFCPVIFYDLNCGNNVNTKKIQMALHFVYERARVKSQNNNVIILITWGYRMTQRLYELDNFFHFFSQLDNVAIICSAGNQSENIDDQTIYPNCCDNVITIGSVTNVNGQYEYADVSNFGKTVNCYINSDNTAYACIYGVTIFSLFWLLDSNCGVNSIKEIFFKKCCSEIVIGNDKVKVINNCENAIEYLIGKKLERESQSTKLEEIIESDEDDVVSNGSETVVNFETKQGGISLEEEELEEVEKEVEEDIDDLQTDLKLEKSTRSSIIEKVDKISLKNDFDLINFTKHYLNSLIKVHLVVPNFLKNIIVLNCKFQKNDNISELIIENNINKILIYGYQSSGKTVLAKKIICKVCENGLKNLNQENMKCVIPIYINNFENFIEFTKTEKILINHYKNIIIIIDNFIGTTENLQKINKYEKIVIISSKEVKSLQNFFKIQLSPLKPSFIKNNILKKFPTINNNKTFLLCNSFLSLFSLIYTDLLRIKQKKKEREKIFNINSYLIVQGIVEDLTYEFIDDINIDMKTKKFLKRISIPIISLFAFNLLDQNKFEFDGIKILEKKYDFFITILQNNLHKYKLVVKKDEEKFKFLDLLILKFLSVHHMRNMITTIIIAKKKKIEAIENIFSLFYVNFFDPLFYDCFKFLAKFNNQFGEISKNMDCIAFRDLDNFKEFNEQDKEKKELSLFSLVEEKIEDVQQQQKIAIKIQNLLARLTRISTLKVSEKIELIILFIKNSKFFNISESDKIVSNFIQLLSTENNSSLQEHYIELICKFSNQTSNKVNKNIIQSIQVLCRESSIKNYSISKFLDLINIINFEEVFNYFKELFTENSNENDNENVLTIILDTLLKLSIEFKKNLFHELWWFLDFQNLSNKTYSEIIIVMIKSIENSQQAHQVFNHIKKMSFEGSLLKKNLIIILNEYTENAIYNQIQIDEIYKFLFKVYKSGQEPINFNDYDSVDESDNEEEVIIKKKEKISIRDVLNESSSDNKISILGNLLKKNTNRKLGKDMMNYLFNLLKRSNFKSSSSILRQFEKRKNVKQEEIKEFAKQSKLSEIDVERSNNYFNKLLLENLQEILSNNEILNNLQKKLVKNMLLLYKYFLVKTSKKSFEKYYTLLIGVFLKKKFSSVFFRNLILKIILERSENELNYFLKYLVLVQKKRLSKTQSKKDSFVNVHLKWLVENMYVRLYKIYKKDYHYPLLQFV